MDITLIGVGKLKEPFFREASDYFSRQLSKLCRFQIIEIKDEKTDEHNSSNQNEAIKNREGKVLLKQIPPRSYIIALAIDGVMKDTKGFSEILHRHSNQPLVFLIGGSLGLSEEVLKKAHMRLSFSPMTFPHQLMRILFLEQLVTALSLEKS